MRHDRAIPMRSQVASAVILAASLLFLAGIAATPAAAKIKCKGISQVTKSGLLSTLYCRDLQIARVARSYGWRVSDAEVRNDPLKKVRICQALGGDIRLQGACGAYGPHLYR